MGLAFAVEIDLMRVFAFRICRKRMIVRRVYGEYMDIARVFAAGVIFLTLLAHRDDTGAVRIDILDTVEFAAKIGRRSSTVMRMRAVFKGKPAVVMFRQFVDRKRMRFLTADATGRIFGPLR